MKQEQPSVQDNDKPSKWVMDRYVQKSKLAPTVPPPAIFQAAILEYLDKLWEDKLKDLKK